MKYQFSTSILVEWILSEKKPYLFHFFQNFNRGGLCLLIVKWKVNKVEIFSKR